MTRLAALILACAPTLAAAQCPTAADLSGQGILMVQDDGTTEFYVAGQPGTTRAMLRHPDGSGGNNVFAQGVHLLQLMDVENGRPLLETLMVFDYPMPPEEMPVPRPGLTWEVEYQMTDSFGRFSERQVQSWGAAETRNYGACSYTVIPGTIEYFYDGGGHTEGLLYFPDLGVSFLTSWIDPSMPEPDRYDLADIRVGP